MMAVYSSSREPVWNASMSRLFISVVDDDESVRESLESLLKSVGFNVNLFGGAEEFLEADQDIATDCLILDVSLSGMSGPDLQRTLLKASPRIPIIFITAHATEALRERVMADGAIDFLLKPFSEEALLTAVEKSLHRSVRDDST
jgi:FixJ family two-component response regulator